MRSLLRSSLALLAIAVGGLLAFSQLGFADITAPWKNLHVSSTTETMYQPKPATITEIEPISLDCRARIHTTVPIEGRREHRVLGQVYRTDTVEMTAIGDIDTCVDSDQVQVTNNDDGTASVRVPAEAIQFVRPRIDAEATVGSVDYDRGLVGKFTDLFPWVSDNSGLTPAAYAYAQAVVGSSDCMAQAYDLTTQAMIDAYRDQMVEQGFDADDIEVTIHGTPDFGGSIDDETVIGGYDFEVNDGGEICEVAPDAYGSTSTDPDDLS
ncbi:MAG: hypothetical protein RIB98_09045 [Acidimicrobiales bacterium]